MNATTSKLAGAVLAGMVTAAVAVGLAWGIGLGSLPAVGIGAGAFAVWSYLRDE